MEEDDRVRALNKLKEDARWENEQLQLENDRIQLKLTQKKLLAEEREIDAKMEQQGQGSSGSWIELDVTKASQGQPDKAVVRVKSSSPPNSPTKEH